MNSTEAKNEMIRFANELRGEFPPALVSLAIINVRMVRMHSLLLAAGMVDIAREQDGIINEVMEMLSSALEIPSSQADQYVNVRELIIKKSEELGSKVIGD